MRPAENIEKLIKKFCQTQKSSVTTSAAMDEKVLAGALSAYQKSKLTQSAAFEPSVWRIIMKKPLTKLATAAAVLLIAASAIVLLEHSATPAYAVEQTIEAMRKIDTIHCFGRDWANREFELWIKVSPETGTNDCHYINEPERGQISISTPQITYFYQPSEKKVRVVEGQALRSDIRFGRFIEDIQNKITQDGCGEIRISKEYDPNTETEVTVLTAKTSTDEFKALIDLETKLPIRIYFTKAVTGQMVKNVDEIYYNEPLPEGLFDFKIPEGVEVIKEPSILTTLNDPNYGIVTEGLTRNEACAKIVKEFWSKVISRDFEAAHKLLPVASAEYIRNKLDELGGVVELAGIGETFDKADCTLGPLTPVRVKFSDGKIWELYQITYFKTIDGQPSCVLAGEGQPHKVIE